MLSDPARIQHYGEADKVEVSRNNFALNVRRIPGWLTSPWGPNRRSTCHWSMPTSHRLCTVRIARGTTRTASSSEEASSKRPCIVRAVPVALTALRRSGVEDKLMSIVKFGSSKSGLDPHRTAYTADTASSGDEANLAFEYFRARRGTNCPIILEFADSSLSIRGAT
jgi:hypothetical protein